MIADVREKITKQEPMLQVEFPQLLQDMIGDLTSAPRANRDQAVFAGPGGAARMGAQGGGRHQEDSAAWWIY